MTHTHDRYCPLLGCSSGESHDEPNITRARIMPSPAKVWADPTVFLGHGTDTVANGASDVADDGSPCSLAKDS